jgi:hypothetical protein
MPMRQSKIAPAFFIGLGGCGGAIVDELARKVKQEESFERYQDLIHFFALDTDTDDLARLSWIDTAHRFTLSDFAKPEYVELKQGKLHAKPDEIFTQWWPEWYRPRDTRGKGAGQIRIESRLAFHHHLENDTAKIIETFEKAVRRAYDVHNPYRANKAAKVYIYASLAGGTGSGGFAIMAYTVRRILGGQRGHHLIGTFVLPNVFKSKGLPPNQFDKIMANGYSALQELELLMTAKPELRLEFHYDPDHPEHRLVDRPPFDQVYLVEEKTSGGVVIADPTEVYPAIADAAHTQIFSSIIDKEGSTLDNDTRELMQLDEQTFTKGFGSFGISALVLPIEDIVEYCALRLGAELLMSAVPGGGAALGDGTDLESADEAFVRGLEAKAEQRTDQGEPFRRAVGWVKGGGAAGGEGAVAAFSRRCKEDVLKRIDGVIKLRGWDETELANFEKDPERLQGEIASAWQALGQQMVKSEDLAVERARAAAAEVAGTGSDLALAEIAKGKGPTEARYFYAILRQALLLQQDELRKAYERSLNLSDGRLQEDFRRKVDELKAAAPETLLEKLPGRENDYFAVAGSFASWYRDVLEGLRWRVRSNAMLEFASAVIKEIDRRRTSTFHFFARVDRVCRQLEQRATRLLSAGGERREGGDANRFVLDVEVLQDHRSGRRLWEHLYRRIVRPSDFQLSGALGKLADVSSSGGAEQDIQRRIMDELLAMARAALRPRIAGGRDERGLRLDEELAFEAKLVTAHARFLQDGAHAVPPPADPRWDEEARRTPEAAIGPYMKDKLEHAASKCRPFITLGAGAPLLPEKAYVVMHREYEANFGPPLANLAAHRVDKGQIIESEDPFEVVFYAAQLGCPLHAVKSLVDYERRYFAVKQKELTEGSKVVGLPKGVPQIPIHQDRNWEGSPDVDTRLFRISIEGVKENDSKTAWADRMTRRRERHGDVAAATDDLRDFTVGVALGLIRYRDDGPAGAGYYLEDEDLAPDARRLGKFRDQAFAAYRSSVELQKQWLRRETSKRVTKLQDDRDLAAIRTVCDGHIAEMEKLVKNAQSVGGKPVADHLTAELAAFAAFRAEKGL